MTRIILSFLIALALADNTLAAENLEVRTLLVPEQEAQISSLITGRIIQMPVKEGKRFKKDQTLVEFDCKILRAELEKARIELETATEMHNTQLRLQKFGSTSELQVTVASSKKKMASAEVLVMEAKTDMCLIKAPFNGRVIKRLAHPSENVDPGVPIMEILDDTKLKLHLQVPSGWLSWLKAKQKFSVHIDETGRSYAATISGLGAKVNPVSQTIEVDAVINKHHSELLAGMSGTATFTPPAEDKAQ
ncbi:MAG: efflux RND transporter periplasmic adaptor subunit [Desulfobulbaceae bacterium]|nr:efflux RND transporter periplasmic adaptor subunit [Desulfobulbaceae bacterium]